MKTYFTCSARGNRQLKNNYLKIFEIIENLGYFHVDDYRKANDPKKVYESSREQIYNFTKRQCYVSRRLTLSY